MVSRRKRAVFSNQRRGAISVFAAFCLIIVIAFLAFSIDLGYLSVSESNLQNAADSAAVSAARALPDREAATNAAIEWAAKNFAAGENVTLQPEDVEFGIWDDTTASFTVLEEEDDGTPNAVRINCRRDEENGKSLNLFFAPLLGTSHAKNPNPASA